MAENAAAAAPKRTYEEENAYITKLDDVRYEIREGFVADMRVPGKFYVNSVLRELMFDELAQYTEARGVGGFLPAMKQVRCMAQDALLCGRERPSDEKGAATDCCALVLMRCVLDCERFATSGHCRLFSCNA